MGIADRIRRRVKAFLFKNEYADAPGGKYYEAQCGSFAMGGGFMESDLVQACLATNARHTAKARARVVRMTKDGMADDPWNTRLERLLNQQPNPQMTGYNYLFNVRALCDEKGMAIIFVDRAADGWPQGFYPIFYDSVYALVDQRDMITLRGFEVNWGGKQYRFPLNNLIVLYRGLVRDKFYGVGNEPIYHSLNMIAVSDAGTENAIKLSSSLRGILKSTKGMLDNADTKETRDRFVNDYVGLTNTSGIAALDATYDFTPLNMDPKTVNSQVTAGYEKRVMRFFGQNDSILMNDYSEQQWTSYYEGNVEPFLIELSQATTNTCFTAHERGFRNEVLYESNRLLYASTQTKLQLAALVDRGLLSLNEFREVMTLPPVEGGDERVIRKEYTNTDNIGGGVETGEE